MAMVRTLIRMLHSEMTSFARRVDTIETRMTRLEQRHDYAIAQLHDTLTGRAAVKRGPSLRNLPTPGPQPDGNGDGDHTPAGYQVWFDGLEFSQCGATDNHDPHVWQMTTSPRLVFRCRGLHRNAQSDADHA